MASWCLVFAGLFSTSALRISLTDVVHSGRAKAKSPVASSGPECINPKGERVDYWYALKLPNGWKYAYMDATTPLNTQSGELGDQVSPLDRTLNQLYVSFADLSYAMWSDQPANRGNWSAPRAHAKGVLALNSKQTGFWLTHSIPRFPQLPTRFRQNSISSYARAKEPRYAQSLLCITVGRDVIPELVKVFEKNWNSVYGAADNAKIGGEFAEWALRNAHDNPWDASRASYVAEVSSLGGKTFTAFGKSAALSDDLYEALVAPRFQTDFIVETWLNGIGKMDSVDKSEDPHEYSVANVMEVEIPGADPFSSSSDHSKWAVSLDGEVFCVGDINRQVGNTKRGGGTICISDNGIAGQMLNTVNRIEVKIPLKIYAVGDRVEALSTEDEEWYPAIISKVYKKGLYKVDWDDKEYRCDRKKTRFEVRLVVGPPQKKRKVDVVKSCKGEVPDDPMMVD